MMCVFSGGLGGRSPSGQYDELPLATVCSDQLENPDPQCQSRGTASHEGHAHVEPTETASCWPGNTSNVAHFRITTAIAQQYMCDWSEIDHHQ